MEERLKPKQTTFSAGKSDAVGICREVDHGQDRSVAPSRRDQGLSERRRKLGAQVTGSLQLTNRTRPSYAWTGLSQSGVIAVLVSDQIEDLILRQHGVVSKFEAFDEFSAIANPHKMTFSVFRPIDA